MTLSRSAGSPIDIVVFRTRPPGRRPGGAVISIPWGPGPQGEACCADTEPARAPRAPAAEGEDRSARAQVVPAEAGRLHARVHHHPEEAEFGAAQGRARAPDQ